MPEIKKELTRLFYEAMRLSPFHSTLPWDEAVKAAEVKAGIYAEKVLCLLGGIKESPDA